MERKNGISFITPFEREYPEKLRNIPDAPSGLYVRGRFPVGTGIAVAVIGARDCSDYGRYVAEELGTFLGKNGITVVSGMARGIDGISQWAALEAGGTSIGVLGCGADICYPAGNRSLYERLLEQGTILSEYPPGTPPRPMNFPPRNRIVSGLADAVVVIEARNRSGTLITVDMALEQGREVFVLPGRITDRLSDGCNRLLKQGAGVMLSPEELLEELRELRERTAHREDPGNGKPAGTGKDGRTLGKEEPPGTGKGSRTPENGEPPGTGKGSRTPENGEPPGTGKDGRTPGKEEPPGKGAGGKTQESQKRKRQKSQDTEALYAGILPELQGIYRALDFYPRSVEQIMEHLPSDLSRTQVVTQLIRLCVDQKAVQVSPGYFKLGKVR